VRFLPPPGSSRTPTSVWLIGRPLVDDLSSRLGRPVRVANDANCFAISEATDGAAAGAPVVFGVIIGTGTGGGIVVRGEPIVGANALAGEWGHNPLPWPMPTTSRRRSVTVESAVASKPTLSGPALAADHRRRSGSAEPVPQIIDRAANGDSDAARRLIVTSRARRGPSLR
jgi:fructokinase